MSESDYKLIEYYFYSFRRRSLLRLNLVCLENHFLPWVGLCQQQVK